ncbi:MAG: hypothetical protein QXU30_07990, partial [Sulfolobales archaeon]
MATKEEVQARIAALKERVSRIRTVKYGDYVLSSDYNEVASCLAEAADILSKLPLTKEIIKVITKVITKVVALTLGLGEDLVTSLAVSGNYLYVGLLTIPGKIVKIDLTRFIEVSILTLDTGEDYVRALAVFGNYLYVGLWTTPGK